MKVSESATCVAYHYKQKRPNIIGYIKTKGEAVDFEYLRRYVLALTDRANKTKAQKRIRSEIVECDSVVSLLSIINRVITNGDKTEFLNY
jgi:hypothetical protein